MERLIKDSDFMMNALEMGDYDDITLEMFANLGINVNAELLLKYYNGEHIADEDLLILATNMDFLMCNELKKILIMIRDKGINYSSLHQMLQREIERLKEIRTIACGKDYIVGLRGDDSLIAWKMNKTDESLNGYDELLKDSNFIQSLDQNSSISSLFPNVHLYLLESYYSNSQINDINLLKLAVDMSYLDCRELDNILLRIKALSLDYNSLNIDLINKISELKNFYQIACGKNHTVVLRDDGTIMTTGNYNQTRNSPTGTGYVSIFCGPDYSVAIHKNDSMAIWGSGEFSQIDDVPGGDNYMAIAAGAYHYVALRINGSIVTWGDNSKNQVSHSPLGNDYVSIACGDYHSVALRKDGTLSTWGSNSNYQVLYTPRGEYLNMHCGVYFSAALRKDGKISVWGSNDLDQIANFPELKRCIEISCGDYQLITLQVDKTILIWNIFEGIKYSSTDKYKKIASGGNHSAALRIDGSLSIW